MATNKAHQTLGSRITIGTIWMVMTRFLMRSLGLISTLILARFLAPSEFGIIAIGVTTMQMLNNFTDIGVSQAVVKYRSSSQSLLDTLFTFSIIRGLCTAIILCLLSFFAVQLFAEPRAGTIFLGIAVVPIIQGFLNPKFHEFQRDLDLSKIFYLEIVSKLGSVGIAIIVAIVTKSFWAIVASMIVGETIKTSLSYFMNPYRPRLALSASKEQYKFLGWTTGLSFIAALNNKLDALLLPRLTNVQITGFYYLGRQLVDLSTNEIAMPAATAVYPGIAEQQHDPDAMKKTFLQSVQVLAAISLPIGFGVAFIAEDLVPLLLGKGWDQVAYVLQIMTPVQAILIMFAALQGYAIARDHTKLVFYRELAFFLVRTPLFIWATIEYQFLGAIAAAAIGSFSKWCISLAVYQQVSGDHFWRPLWCIHRSFVGIACMAFWFFIAGDIVNNIISLPHIAALLFNIMIGALFYCLGHLLIWRIERQPDGIEVIIVNMCAKTLKK